MWEDKPSEDEEVIDPSYIPKTLKRRPIRRRRSSLTVDEAKVLVLYTGGTIGMMKNERGALSPMPNQLIDAVKKYPQLHDTEYCSRHRELEDEHFCVLRTTLHQKRIFYTIFEYEPLLDSSTMTIDDWIKIARDIQTHYEHFDGFVILHGTDTLAYTASALSFMMENLGKTIVITGSQIPIFEIRSDGLENFIGALLIAGHYIVPEVTVFFNNRLLRGNRTVKVNTDSFSAFDSPNMRPLGTIGTTIAIDHRNIFRPASLQKFQVHPKLSRNVALIRFFPSKSSEAMANFLKEPIEGVVLQTFGAGNIPSNRPDLLELLKKAIQRGVIIVNTTQCIRGAVSDVYETGKVLQDIGVINGRDMTSEAALSKLSYVLSKDEWSLEQKRKIISESIRGELTSPIHGKINDTKLIGAIATALQLSTAEETDQLRQKLYPSILNSAVATEDLKSLKTLFAANEVDVTTSDYCERSPLHVACLRGDYDIVLFLLENGAPIHEEDIHRCTPLDYAIETCSRDVVKLLVKVGAHLKMENKELGLKLCSAVMSGVAMLDVMRLAGANLNQPDPLGKTALHRAVEKGDLECVNYLLKYKVNTSLRDQYGHTPEDIAKYLGKVDVLRILNKDADFHCNSHVNTSLGI